MKYFWMLVLLSGIASAQAAPAAFSGDNNLLSIPDTASFEASRVSTPAANSSSPLPNLLPTPEGKPTLIGGTIAKTDRVRDEVTVHVFGGGNTRVLFDGRTRIYRDGVAASADALQNGQRIYVDIMRAGKDTFARNIRVMSQAANGQSVGQVTSYDSASGELVLSDRISRSEIKIQVSSATKVERDGKDADRSELRSGALVSITFSPDGNGKTRAGQVAILAAPGNSFVFVGRVTHLDLRLGLLVVEDPRDQKTYEINFDPHTISASADLHEGAIVEATTSFNGSQYVASNIKVNSNRNQ